MSDSNDFSTGRNLCVSFENAVIDTGYDGRKFYDALSNKSRDSFYLDITTPGEGLNFKVYIPAEHLTDIIRNLLDFKDELENAGVNTRG